MRSGLYRISLPLLLALAAFATGSATRAEDCTLSARTTNDLFRQLIPHFDPCYLTANDPIELAEREAKVACLKKMYLKSGFDSTQSSANEPEVGFFRSQAEYLDAQKKAEAAVPPRVRFLPHEKELLEGDFAKGDGLFARLMLELNRQHTPYLGEALPFIKSEFDEPNSEYYGSHWGYEPLQFAGIEAVPALKTLSPNYPYERATLAVYGLLPAPSAPNAKSGRSMGFIFVTQKRIEGKHARDIRWLGEGEFWYAPNPKSPPSLQQTTDWVRIPWGISCKLKPRDQFESWLFKPGRLISGDNL